jgi:Fibronectin type III domain
MPSQSSASRTATLSWEAPTTNTDGTPLTDLAGYRIYYGSSPQELSHSVQINTVGLQTYVIDDLEPGTWYFAVRAVAADGSESPLSDVAAKTIA